MNRSVAIACAAALLAGSLLVGQAQAQVHIDFGFSPGHGHHHHHHHGWYGHGWGYRGVYPGYYYNPPVEYVYVTPPPPQTIIYGQPTVARPQPAPAAIATNRTTGTPTLATRPSTSSNALPVENGRVVTIRNPSASGGNVAFVVDGENEWELRPGQAKTLASKTAIVEFDRGGDFGSAERELTAGTYRFIVTDEGWDLERESTNAWRTATAPAVRKNALPDTRR